MPSLRTSSLAVALLAVTSAFVAPLATRAQIPSSQLVPEDVRDFASDYVAAINAKDSAKLWSFLTPETRSCVNPANKDVYDLLFNIQFDDAIPPNYLLVLAPVSEANLKSFAESQFFAIPPENQLQINYQVGDDAESLILWLVHQNGRLYADQPCATVEFIIRYRVEAAARAHIKDLAAEIQDPLRTELLTLVAQKKRSAAIARYKAATTCDMRTAMLVITTLKHAAALESASATSAAK
jgi:hypothetical protein